ncbi:CAP domain-containing protein [Vibrio breoganii]
MRYIPIILLSTLLIGCGSGSSSTSNSEPNSETDPTNDPIATVPDSDGSTPGNEDGSEPESTSPDEQTPEQDDFASLMLTAVNHARSIEQNCGGTIMPAVPALKWNYDLEAAAFRHSSDMANGDFMDHTGSDGSTPAERVADTGYSANAWAENVAAGQNSIDNVMASWMSSAGHCQNIMSSNVTEMGASAVENADTQYGIYWTQVFANAW